LARNTFPDTNPPSVIRSVISGVDCRSVARLNCFRPSPVKSFLTSALVEICGQGFGFLLHTCLERGLFDEKRGRSFVYRGCVCCTVVSSLTDKLLLALASTAILDSKSQGAHNLVLRCGWLWERAASRRRLCEQCKFYCSPLREVPLYIKLLDIIPCCVRSSKLSKEICFLL
jgi:hypothetical protein